MIRSVHFPALAIAACFAACSTSSPRIATTSVRQGMTSAELLSIFGRPLRVERNPSGGEDWFYNFGAQRRESHPVSKSTTSEAERSYSFGHTTSTTTTMTQAPVHLSPGGRVVGAIPSGGVVLQ